MTNLHEATLQLNMCWHHRSSLQVVDDLLWFVHLCAYECTYNQTYSTLGVVHRQVKDLVVDWERLWSESGKWWLYSGLDKRCLWDEPVATCGLRPARCCSCQVDDWKDSLQLLVKRTDTSRKSRSKGFIAGCWDLMSDCFRH